MLDGNVVCSSKQHDNSHRERLSFFPDSLRISGLYR